MNATTTLENVRSSVIGSSTTLSPEMATSVMAALYDRFSRKMMICAVVEARTIEEISSGEGVPLSTCYRRMRELVDAGLMLVERIVLAGSGKRYATYRSCFRSFSISFNSHGLFVEAEVNELVSERIHDRQLAVRYAGQSVGVS